MASTIPEKEVQVSDHGDTEKSNTELAAHPSVSDFGFTEEEQKRIIRHVDIRLVLTIGVLYCVSLMDRTNLGVASVAGMQEDLALTVGTRYVSFSPFRGEGRVVKDGSSNQGGFNTRDSPSSRSFSSSPTSSFNRHRQSWCERLAPEFTFRSSRFYGMCSMICSTMLSGRSLGRAVTPVLCIPRPPRTMCLTC